MSPAARDQMGGLSRPSGDHPFPGQAAEVAGVQGVHKKLPEEGGFRPFSADTKPSPLPHPYPCLGPPWHPPPPHPGALAHWAPLGSLLPPCTGLVSRAWGSRPSSRCSAGPGQLGADVHNKAWEPSFGCYCYYFIIGHNNIYFKFNILILKH